MFYVLKFVFYFSAIVIFLLIFFSFDKINIIFNNSKKRKIEYKHIKNTSYFTLNKKNFVKKLKKYINVKNKIYIEYDLFSNNQKIIKYAKCVYKLILKDNKKYRFENNKCVIETVA